MVLHFVLPFAEVIVMDDNFAFMVISYQYYGNPVLIHVHYVKKAVAEVNKQDVIKCIQIRCCFQTEQSYKFQSCSLVSISSVNTEKNGM